MPTKRVLKSPVSIAGTGLLCALLFTFLCLGICPASARAQDSTVYADDFQSFNVGTLARGCGDMTANSWRWESHHHYACYSAGWGVDYDAPMGGASTTSDKELVLWGGVPFGGGGDCAAAATDPELQSLSDYSVTVRLSPISVVDEMFPCKRGTMAIAARVQGTSAFCSGYLLALVLNNGESLCGQGSYLQLLRNERGPFCDGSEALTLLASEPVDITADLGGMFDSSQEYVLSMCMEGSQIYGGVWTAQDWDGGAGPPLAEVTATDETYVMGTIGVYQGSARCRFDDVSVTTGGSCMSEEQDGLLADLDFDPNTLNLKSKGKYVTSYVELSEGYDPRDIDLSTVLLNDVVPAEMRPTGVGDYDMDGVEDRMIKFDRSAVIELVGASQNMVVSGGTSGGAEWCLGGGAGGGAEWQNTGGSGGAEWSTGPAAEAGSQIMALGHADTVEVWVSGLLTDGTAFHAADTIRVIGGANGPANGPSGGPEAGKGKGSGGSIGARSAGAGTAVGFDGGPVLKITPTVVTSGTRIGFELAAGSRVGLYIYDAAGRRVKTLMEDYAGPGVHYVMWNRDSDTGAGVPPGVYFVRLSRAGDPSGRKLMVVD